MSMDDFVAVLFC